MEPKPVINIWANFLSNEKLDPKAVSPADAVKLMDLCERLAEIQLPYRKLGDPPRPAGHGPSHAQVLAARRLVCNTAMDMGLDLMAIKGVTKHKAGKPIMGRGLLDVWNAVYLERFGSTVGTSGAHEVIRRKVVTKLSGEHAPTACSATGRVGCTTRMRCTAGSVVGLGRYHSWRTASDRRLQVSSL
jgi:hypothetical protein